MSPVNVSLKIRKRAESLRRRGYLFSEIATELGAPKTTVCGWVAAIQLTQEEQQLVRERLRLSKASRATNMTQARKAKSLEREVATTALAIEASEKITLNRAQKQLVCALLFWCEGGKDIASGIHFINSDPLMIQTYMRLFRESFEVDESKFRVMLHLHDYHKPKKQLKYWAKLTGIPESQFYKPYLKPHTGKQIRLNYPGCVSVRYLDKQFGLYLKMLYTSFGNKYRGIV